MSTIYDEIKLTISKLLQLYHAYIALHDNDRALAGEMESYARKNAEYGQYYQKMAELSPSSIRPFYGHIEALIKLSPALNLCIKDHSKQLDDSNHQIGILTEALNKINEFIGHGIEGISNTELSAFQKDENDKADQLIRTFPELEKNHDSITLRFNIIKKELGVFNVPVLE